MPPADPALDAASGVVMLATKSVVAKGSSVEESEGSAISVDTKGIEAEAGLIAEALAHKPSAGLSPGFLQKLSAMRVTPQLKVYLNATLESLKPIFTTIVEGASNDTALRDSIYAGFGQIAQDLNKSKAVAEGQGTATVAARTRHTDCRQAEGVLLTQKNDCGKELSVCEKEKAVALAEVEIAHGTKTSALCPPVTPLSKFGIDDYKTLEDQALVIINTSRTYRSKEAAFKEKQAECLNISSTHTAKRLACTTEQRSFEVAVCQQGSTVKTSCKQYTSSYSTTLRDYNAVASSIAIKEDDRKMEWQHLKRIQCIIEAIVDAHTDGDFKSNTTISKRILACSEKDFRNAALDISDKIAPQPEGCLAEPLLPCSQAFVRTEYIDVLPQEAPAAACENGCEATTTTITTTTTTTVGLFIKPLSVEAPRIYWSKSMQADEDSRDSGLANDRTLSFTKVKDNSRVLLMYSDDLRIANLGKCSWEILVDGRTCSSGAIRGDLGGGKGGMKYSGKLIAGMCDNLKAGRHTLSVKVSRTLAADCHTGWGVKNLFTLEAQEIAPNLPYWHYKSGFDEDNTDIGAIRGRQLSFVKQDANTDLRLFYADRFTQTGHGGSCEWQLLIDGKPCPSRKLIGTMHTTDRDTRPYPDAITGVCSGVPAGSHTLTVSLSRMGHPDCYSGFRVDWWTRTWALEVYEKPMADQLLHMVTGPGGNEGRDEGQLTGRTLAFTKHSADSRLRITYYDNFRVLDGSCHWEVKIDGKDCPKGRLQHSMQTQGRTWNDHLFGTLVGICDGVPAGSHTLTAAVTRHGGSSDCFTGWHDAGGAHFHLEAQELEVGTFH